MFMVRREHYFLFVDDKNGICGKLGGHLTKILNAQTEIALYETLFLHYFKVATDRKIYKAYIHS